MSDVKLLREDDYARVRTFTLDRPEALNAFNEALYDQLTEALLAAASDPSVAVVLLTGEGRAFSAGTDLTEIAERTVNPDFVPGTHCFLGLIDALPCQRCHRAGPSCERSTRRGTWVTPSSPVGTWPSGWHARQAHAGDRRRASRRS